MKNKKVIPVTNSVLEDMRSEAISQMADPKSKDIFMRKMDYPARVNSRDLLAVLDELQYLRQKVKEK